MNMDSRYVKEINFCMNYLPNSHLTLIYVMWNHQCGIDASLKKDRLK